MRVLKDRHNVLIPEAMPVSDVLIIALDEIKERTNLSKNVSNAKLEPAQRRAHVTLEKILGRTFYAEIQAAITIDSDLTGEPDLLLLVRYYIKDYVAYLNVYNSVYDVQLQSNKTGRHTTSDDGYDALSPEALRSVRQDAKEATEEYQDQLIRFLNDSEVTAYDSYETTTDSEDRIKKLHPGGFWVADGRSKIYEPRNRGPYE